VSLPSTLPSPSTGREYSLKRVSRPVEPVEREPARIVPSRPSPLKRGGGRRDNKGWTKQKRRSCRKALKRLNGIHTCLTVTLPHDYFPEDCQALDSLLRSVCGRFSVPSVGVWEGLSPHIHIAFGGLLRQANRRTLERRLFKFWADTWGCVPCKDAWKFDPNPKQGTLNYLAKWKKGNVVVKADFEWLCFCPWWQRNVPKTSDRKPIIARREKSPCLPASTGHHCAPQTTVLHAPETSVNYDKTKESPSLSTITQNAAGLGLRLLDNQPVCGVCWRKWGRALKVGCCVCSGHVTLV